MGRVAGKVFRVVGPVVELEEAASLRMLDMVEVGEEHLVGEVVRLKRRQGIYSSIRRYYIC